MTDLRIALTIISETALSVGAGGSAGTLADKSIVRDGWNRPIIPGSQVKGKLRWAVEQLLRGLGDDVPTPFDERGRVEQEQIRNELMGKARPNFVRAIFGSPEHRSSLHFADLPGIVGPLDQAEALRAGPEQHRSQIRPSVSINRRRGTAEDARLLFQEIALEETRFHADPAIIGSVPDLGHAALLWAGLRLTTRWGGAKSRGLGWASVEVRVCFGTQDQDDGALSQALRDLLSNVRSD